MDKLTNVWNGLYLDEESNSKEIFKSVFNIDNLKTLNTTMDYYFC